MPPKKPVKKKYVGAPKKGGQGVAGWQPGPGDTVIVAKRKAPAKRRTR